MKLVLDVCKLRIETMLDRYYKIRKPIATALLWLLLCAVLFSQYLGYAHRVSHINSLAGEVLTVGLNEQGQIELRKLTDVEAQIHSCLLLDASTIVDALQHTLTFDISTVLIPRENVLASSYAWVSRFSAIFLSRAPPSSL